MDKRVKGVVLIIIGLMFLLPAFRAIITHNLTAIIGIFIVYLGLKTIFCSDSCWSQACTGKTPKDSFNNSSQNEQDLHKS
jgi:uncharacterized membrane protein